MIPSPVVRTSVVVLPLSMVAVFSLRPSFISPPLLYGGACVNVKTAAAAYRARSTRGVVTVTKNAWSRVGERVGQGRDRGVVHHLDRCRRVVRSAVIGVPLLSCTMVTVAPLMKPVPVMVIAVLCVV